MLDPSHAAPASATAASNEVARLDANEELPLVSVLMPIRNEEHTIRDSLAAVLQQEWPVDRLEIFVIDGASTDGTRQAVLETAAAVPDAPPVRLLLNESRYVPHGLNLGLRQARGAYIARVDGHCMVGRDHIRKCFEGMQATGADNVGGLAYAVAEGPVARAVAAGASSPFGVGGARFRHRSPRPGWVDTVFPGFWRRETFERLGGFDEELVKNQDDEFNLRLRQYGGRVWLDPQLRTLYRARDSLRGLWGQYFEYGLYKVRVAQKRGGLGAVRHVVPAAFVVALATSLAAAAVAGSWWLALAVAAPYGLAVLAASVLTASRARDARILPCLPIVFATLHVAYGCGFLGGLWRWRRHGLPRLRMLRTGAAPSATPAPRQPKFAPATPVAAAPPAKES